MEAEAKLKLTEAEAKAKMGRRPISVRWVETNKGVDAEPTIRSRLVAREIRAPGQDAISRASSGSRAGILTARRGLRSCW